MSTKKLTSGLALLAVTALGLSACGSKANIDPLAATDDVAKLVSINEKPVDQLEDGGVITLPVNDVPSNLNVFTIDGNYQDGSAIQAPMMVAACYNSNPRGDYVLDENFCRDAKSEYKDGVQTISFKFNPEAKYNDGTPFTVDVIKNLFKVHTTEGFRIVTPGDWAHVEKVEAGADDREVIITMKKDEPVFPWQHVIAGELLHPAVNTPEIFNKGFVDNFHPEWKIGPFTLESYDQQNRIVVLKRNDKWFGEKPRLEKIIYKAMEANATLPAFKAGEINATGAATEARYKELQDTPNVDFRRGQRLGTCGLEVNANAEEMKDVAVRKALFQAIDRGIIAQIQFKPLGWTEEVPSSWVILPFQKDFYKDIYPTKDNDPEGAMKTLEEAGYTKNANGFYEKDGKEVAFKLTNFSDDPTAAAQVQRQAEQLKKAGMNVGIDTRGSADFNNTWADMDFSVINSCFSAGNALNTASNLNQFFASTGSEAELLGCTVPELDEKIKAAPGIENDKERVAKVLEIEKEYHEKCYTMMTFQNGPSITAVNKYLANYGPRLFGSTDWSKVGWEKGHKDGK